MSRLEEFWRFSTSSTTTNFDSLTSNVGNVAGLIFEPDDAGPIDPVGRIFVGVPKKIDGQRFERVSLSKTRVQNVVFRECVFDQCHLISTAFINCEFHNCQFFDTNVLKIKFYDCYIDPKSFESCLSTTLHSNIGVSLYQSLYRNSLDVGQAKFALESDFNFRLWNRHQKEFAFQKQCESCPPSTWKKISHYALTILDNMYEKLFAYGTSLKRIGLTSFLFFFFFASMSFFFAKSFGLQAEPEASMLQKFVHAAYFSAVSMTTVGYGDITPEETLGRVFSIVQAIVGFIMFAFLAATIFKRGSR